MRLRRDIRLHQLDMFDIILLIEELRTNIGIIIFVRKNVSIK